MSGPGYTLGYTLPLMDCQDVALIGGKAANLGKLIRAGFPVPGGFAVTTRAYRAAALRGSPVEISAEMAQEILRAYRAMGGGVVAVRSSATAEDLAAASMAGQYDTFLDIDGDEQLLDAVRRCWESLNSPRIRAYLHEHAIDPATVAMAVVVQRLICAEVAGVLFTANPHPHVGREMLIEASWGLGESVVSGRVQPDVWQINAETGAVIRVQIADKRVQLAAGTHEERPVEEARRRAACLGEQNIVQLWQLGRRTAEHFGAPQDMEWALAGDELYLLQSRPITTHQESQAISDVLDQTRRELRAQAALGRGPWVLHNLAETLGHPTPLTWSVIRRFMSGAGGFGEMYRAAGFRPSAAVRDEGFLQLVAGRIYMDAARAPEMFCERFPFAYDARELAQRPDASQSPPTVPTGKPMERLRAGRMLGEVQKNLTRVAADLDGTLRGIEFPAFEKYVVEQRAARLADLSVQGFVALWQKREHEVMDAFAPRTLLPSLIGAMALGQLRAFLDEHFWDEDTEALANVISSGGEPDCTVRSNAELYEVAAGKRALETWLGDHGHRAAGEFDLAAPRGREQPAAAREMVGRLASGDDPMERYHKHAASVAEKIAELESQLTPAERRELRGRIELVRRYMAFREDGKDFLMRGYELLRDLAQEAGRRLDVGDDIYFLEREEIFEALRDASASAGGASDAGITAPAVKKLMAERKALYQAQEQLQRRITLPNLIESSTIDALGEPSASSAEPANGHRAMAVSAGRAVGPARIVRSPAEAPDLGRGYILVCPSTDPSWTPLFVNAAGLVLECGGTLSHGAVVAREMGLPAAVLPDAMRLLAEGQEICVDGTSGWVGSPQAAADAVRATAESDDPGNAQLPRTLLPPPASAKDRRAARIRNITGLIWSVYLLAFFCLPAALVEEPAMRAIDIVLWPLVVALGRPGTVAVVSIGIALVTLLLQKFLTDNARLLEGKRRAAELDRLANKLPNSPRRDAMLRAAAGVQMRTLAASMVPVGILLGPMVMPFTWFSQRLDPTLANASAGAPIQIVAMVDADAAHTVTLDAPGPLALDDTTPAANTTRALRPALEKLLARYQHTAATDTQPAAQLPGVVELGQQMAQADLQAYLEAGIPPQAVKWTLRPPENLTGRFEVKFAADSGAPVSVPVIWGDDFAPGPRAEGAPALSPIKSIKIIYPRPAREAVFWRPLAFLAGHDGIPLAARLGAWDIGYLWTYILSYLPILYLARWILRVA